MLVIDLFSVFLVTHPNHMWSATYPDYSVLLQGDVFSLTVPHSSNCHTLGNSDFLYFCLRVWLGLGVAFEPRVAAPAAMIGASNFLNYQLP